jgi:cysteine synthase
MYYYNTVLCTGPELYEQTGGKLDAWVSAVGTGGTLAGTSRYLKVLWIQYCLRTAAAWY